MGISNKSRLSFGDLLLSFGAVAFPFHVWAVIHLLKVFPAWLLRMSTAELAGAVSYPLTAALLESLAVWLILVILAFLLPRRWLAEKFVAASSLLAWVLALWAVVAQFMIDDLLQWGPALLISGLAFVIITLGAAVWLVARSRRLEAITQSMAQRLSVLTYFYMFFDLLGVVVITIRNLGK